MEKRRLRGGRTGSGWCVGRLQARAKGGRRGQALVSRRMGAKTVLDKGKRYHFFSRLKEKKIASLLWRS